MSDHFLVVIPADPRAVLPVAATVLRDRLAEMAGTTECRIKDYGKLQFIDSGENFESIACPFCAQEMAIEQWHEWMDADWHDEEGFHLHSHQTECCSKTCTLNELVYRPHQGFARWFISARNANRGPLTGDEIETLSALAGLRLRAIAQMY